jgi:hypothetical protein
MDLKATTQYVFSVPDIGISASSIHLFIRSKGKGKITTTEMEKGVNNSKMLKLLKQASNKGLIREKNSMLVIVHVDHLGMASIATTIHASTATILCHLPCMWPFYKFCNFKLFTVFEK